MRQTDGSRERDSVAPTIGSPAAAAQAGNNDSDRLFRPRNPFQIVRDRHPDEKEAYHYEDVTDDEESDDGTEEIDDDALAERVRFLEPSDGGDHRQDDEGLPTRRTIGNAASTRGGRGAWIRTALAIAATASVLLGWALYFDAGGGRTPVPSPSRNNDQRPNTDTQEEGTSLVPVRALNTTLYFPASKYAQIQNYRQKNALLLHLHLTHHGGTTVCSVLGWPFSAPPFACRVDRHHERLPANLTNDPRFNGGQNPWYANETDTQIDLLRPYYHMVSWEYGVKAPEPRFQVTDWENPRLVSVIVMRDPLSRLLAGDGYVGGTYHIKNATREVWWEYATTDHGDTNNVMLHDLSADRNCCQGADTPRERLQEAQDLIRRFTFVLDLECLEAGMRALMDVLGLEYTPSPSSQKSHAHSSPEERIPFPDVYQFLKERNRLDQELYEWSKNLSLVRCADLKP